MPFNIVYVNGLYYIKDAITGFVYREKGFNSPEDIAKEMIYYWKMHSSEPVPSDAYSRWYRTAEIAKQHPGEEISIVTRAGEPTPTPPPKTMPVAFTFVDLKGRIDILRSNLATFRRTKDKYIEAEVEDHNRKFPADRGSNFVQNLYNRVETERNHYAAKLEGSLFAIEGVLSKGWKDWTAIQKVSNYAIAFLDKIMPDMLQGTDRYISAEKARRGFVTLKNMATMFVPEVAPRQEIFEIEEGHSEYRPGSGRLF